MHFCAVQKMESIGLKVLHKIIIYYQNLVMYKRGTSLEYKKISLYNIYIYISICYLYMYILFPGMYVQFQLEMAGFWF